MVKRDDIIDSFAAMSIDLPDDVVDKCMELCKIYRINDSDNLFDSWSSYASKHHEDGVAPTVDALTTMEKKGFFKKSSNKDTTLEYKSPVRSYEESDDLPIIEDNVSQFPTSVNLSPVVQVKPRDSIPNNVTPALKGSFSEENPTKEFQFRKNSGHIVCSYGNVDSLTWTTSEKYSPIVDFGEEFNPVDSSVKYMFCTMMDKIQHLHKQGESICTKIIENNDLKTPLETRQITMETATFAGRILCDGRGKLNPSSLLLESCLYSIREDKVKLEIHDAPDYCLFPGQVIVVEGKNPDGKRIIAEKIYSDVNPESYPDFEPSKNLKEPLQIVVACGSFMLSNGSYKPFRELREYVVKNLPHAVILIGPFIDAQNPNILQFDHKVKFVQCYEEGITSLLNALDRVKAHTKVIVTSSWKEATLHVIYPTPQTPVLSLKHPNLSLVPDPSILDIAGFHIGVTSTDILLHLSPEELCHSNTPQNVPRLCRIASHLLKQQSFYPLKPCHDEMSVDVKLLIDHAAIPLKPHVLVLPSNLKSFVNVADDCVIINPERIAKGEYGGSFARIQVRPAAVGEKWSPASHISAQVIKI